MPGMATDSSVDSQVQADATPSADHPASTDQTPSVDDGFLVASMLAGDAAALNRLIERYDRLVRYTVLRVSQARCARDPQWLESVASATWAGFVRSMRRNPNDPPRNIRAYLVRIARNKTVSALRSEPPTVESLHDHMATQAWTMPPPDDMGTQTGTMPPPDDMATQARTMPPSDHMATQAGTVPRAAAEERDVAAELEEPVEILEKLEHLELLRDCLAELGSDDRTLLSQLAAITERRWTQAAEALGISESTLRSRWERTLVRLRRCMERKKGPDSVAPPA
jgi:RNA polymerase sigma factor (sigma-70 family)